MRGAQRAQPAILVGKWKRPFRLGRESQSQHYGGQTRRPAVSGTGRGVCGGRGLAGNSGGLHILRPRRVPRTGGRFTSSGRRAAACAFRPLRRVLLVVPANGARIPSPTRRFAAARRGDDKEAWRGARCCGQLRRRGDGRRTRIQFYKGGVHPRGRAREGIHPCGGHLRGQPVAAVRRAVYGGRARIVRAPAGVQPGALRGVPFDAGRERTVVEPGTVLEGGGRPGYDAAD